MSRGNSVDEVFCCCGFVQGWHHLFHIALQFLVLCSIQPPSLSPTSPFHDESNDLEAAQSSLSHWLSTIRIFTKQERHERQGTAWTFSLIHHIHAFFASSMWCKGRQLVHFCSPADSKPLLDQSNKICHWEGRFQNQFDASYETLLLKALIAKSPSTAAIFILKWKRGLFSLISAMERPNKQSLISQCLPSSPTSFITVWQYLWNAKPLQNINKKSNENPQSKSVVYEKIWKNKVSLMANKTILK